MSKINLYTQYTDTHAVLLNRFFIPSFYETKMDKTFELHAIKCTQKSETGDYCSNGFRETMIDKLDIIIDACKTNNKQFIFADCDIQFLQNITTDIQQYVDADVYAQTDQGTICSGFMIINPSSKITNYFTHIKDLLSSRPDLYANEQMCINRNLSGVNFELLEMSKYYSIGNYTHSVWTENQPLPGVPPCAMIHHANYTIGISNKIKLLENIKKKFSDR